MDKTMEYYLGLPYTIELKQDAEAGWFVKVKELPGCMSQGDTAAEALEMIQEAMELWLEVAIEDGDPIPEPRDLDEFSGKFVVRVPRSLHGELVDKAKLEGVSLNQYVNLALAQATSRISPGAPVQTGEVPWPGLRASVRCALLAVGLTEETGELEEALFASHMERQWAQVESAVQGRYYRDALWSVRAMEQMLGPAVRQSPVFETVLRILTVLHDQIEQVCKLQQGLVDQTMQGGRVTDAVRQSSVADRAVREVSWDNLVETLSLEEPRPLADLERLLGVAKDALGGTGKW